MKTHLEEADRKAQKALDDGKRAAQKKASKPTTLKRMRPHSDETSQAEASKPSISKYVRVRLEEQTSDEEPSQDEAA